MNIPPSIVPVILCGGSGTRLWPLSRKLYPKPFVKRNNGQTLFADTLQRACHLPGHLPPLLISNEEYRFYILETLAEMDLDADLILEPAPRNTAPALALAALAIMDKGDALMLAMPSDHFFDDDTIFCETVAQAAPLAACGNIVTFGVKPTRPEAGYGYIQQGSPQPDVGFRVSRFVEKPDAQNAQSMLDAGGYFWNSGIFLMPASLYLNELGKWAPDILEACKKAWLQRSRDKNFLRPDKAAFLACPENSIDYAVMEQTEKAAMMPLYCSWNDMGCWDSFYHASQHDNDNNVAVGDVFLTDVKNSYIHAQKRMVAAIGVHDLAIVESGDAVLVLPRERSQEVKKVVTYLKDHNRDELKLHPLVYRPWGSYERLASGSRFQVKRIVVKPDCSLSLQMHHHRSEHWIIVRGTAEITIGDTKSLYTENQSAYIPLGQKHRLYNPGKIPLELIEVQSGSYLGEDDITRFDDIYGRK